ncbi:MAG: hypothetical protein F6K42_02515 [Leptolyngbya sp. SIO1D8]|nr:hypothetical protein [Leptolyngbya sp. SIO1D8]
MINIYPPEVISLRFRFLDEHRRLVDPGRVVFVLQKDDISEQFVLGVAPNLIRQSEGVYKVTLQFLPENWGEWSWHIEGGTAGSTPLIPIGFLKAATGSIVVSKPEVVANA